MSKIQVLIVDDSAFMRKVLKDILQQDPEIEVLGTARNGQDALNKLSVLTPDVITLDIEMPVLDGLTTLEKIVGSTSIPVIMLSSTSKLGTENTMQALEKGAFDFIAKPSGSISLDIHKVQDELIKKIKMAFQHGLKGKNAVKLQDNFLNKNRQSMWLREMDNNQQAAERVQFNDDLKYLILLGTSTGGPKALQKLLLSLPRLKNAAILIVQHMPPGFTLSLAQRLNQLTIHDVKEAQHGDLVKVGEVYIAPGGYHMEVKKQAGNVQIQLHLNPPRGGHRPSVDVLFESAKELSEWQLITVIMTGMGKDGMEGLSLLKENRSVYSIAEDESTCVVYGMPKAVIEANLINEIAPLDQIHLVLGRLIK